MRNIKKFVCMIILLLVVVCQPVYVFADVEANTQQINIIDEEEIIDIYDEEIPDCSSIELNSMDFDFYIAEGIKIVESFLIR